MASVVMRATSGRGRFAAVGAAAITAAAASNVTILSLGKTSNSTGGEGHVAAGGILQPFGSIGVGCGVNWDGDGKGYGGMNDKTNVGARDP